MTDRLKLRCCHRNEFRLIGTEYRRGVTPFLLSGEKVWERKVGETGHKSELQCNGGERSRR